MTEPLRSSSNRGNPLSKPTACCTGDARALCPRVVPRFFVEERRAVFGCRKKGRIFEHAVTVFRLARSCMEQ